MGLPRAWHWGPGWWKGPHLLLEAFITYRAPAGGGHLFGPDEQTMSHLKR
jgi:hypothetical protein